MKILVAEDNHFYRRAIVTTLQEWGYEVVAVSDGVAALDVLVGQPDPPQLAIIDWVMPRMDGLELCTRIRSLQLPEAPYLIVLTSKTSKSDIVTALNAGADDYAAKPFDREELHARIRVGERVTTLQAGNTAVHAFARAVDARSHYTLGHSQRVMQYSLNLAARLGVGSRDMDTLRNGGLLHDIGKIAVPDAILDKPGPLTPEEFEIMKQHPVQGVEIVKPLRSLADVIPLIRSHHERLDGSGYPDGLKDAEIPLLVRILMVADYYDALASRRPYRDLLPFAKCVEILRKEVSDGKLDGAIVREFIDMTTHAIQPSGSKDTVQSASAMVCA